MFHVYILRTSSNTLYTGQTNNIAKRLKEHKSKSLKAAKYTRYFKSFDLVYLEIHKTRSKAMKREAELKRWTKAKKEALIKNSYDVKRHSGSIPKAQASKGRKRN